MSEPKNTTALRVTGDGAAQLNSAKVASQDCVVGRGTEIAEGGAGRFSVGSGETASAEEVHAAKDPSSDHVAHEGMRDYRVDCERLE